MSDPYDYEDEDCWNCGGDGYVYNCLDEIGCIDPESGCDLCEKRCYVCNPRKRNPHPPSHGRAE